MIHIELTDELGGVLFIDPNAILALVRTVRYKEKISYHSGTTGIHVPGGRIILVRETPEQINALMKKEKENARTTPDPTDAKTEVQLSVGSTTSEGGNPLPIGKSITREQYIEKFGNFDTIDGKRIESDREDTTAYERAEDNGHPKQNPYNDPPGLR